MIFLTTKKKPTTWIYVCVAQYENRQAFYRLNNFFYSTSTLHRHTHTSLQNKNCLSSCVWLDFVCSSFFFHFMTNYFVFMMKRFFISIFKSRSHIFLKAFLKKYLKNVHFMFLSVCPFLNKFLEFFYSVNFIFIKFGSVSVNFVFSKFPYSANFLLNVFFNSANFFIQ